MIKKGWKYRKDGEKLFWYSAEYDTVIYRHANRSNGLTNMITSRSYYFHYDSPGGQRWRWSFDRLRDAIRAVESREGRDDE